jgi:glycosyltransferase involved in cell wall biosynthesis
VIPDLVSTIVPVYNRPLLLVDAVASVLDQEYRPFEIIIVDDGSSDQRTPQAAQELAASTPGIVKVVSQANSGPGAAREHGRRASQGEFIQYLDSDDVLLPGKFNAQVRALRERPDADVAYGITYFRDESGRLHDEPHKETGNVIEAMFPKFLNNRWWDTSTPLYRARVCANAGPWTNLRIEEDWEYDCRVASLGGKLAWCPVPVSVTQDHGGDRLSRRNTDDPERLKQRAVAHELIFQHGTRYGIAPGDPEMDVFSRALFLLARQCGAVRLPEESKRLFQLSLQAAGKERSKGVDFRFYALLASTFGWTAMGRLSAAFDRMKAKR